MIDSIFETGIRPLVDAYLEKKSEEKRNYGEYWSASSAGYCMRKLIFERLGVPPTSSDARKTRVFEVGHIFHEWIQRITEDAGISIAQEVELQDEDLMIRGHFDDLVFVGGKITASGETVINSRLILYDYKTAHSKWFDYANRGISHYHRMQLGTYILMLRKCPGVVDAMKDVVEQIRNLSEARILSISKDDLRMHEHVLPWTPVLEKEVYEYWSTLNGYWKSEKLPKCTCADYENGFMARDKFNPFFYEGQPCSIAWYEKWKEEQKVRVTS